MMRFFNRLSERFRSGGRSSRRGKSSTTVESMEQRTLLTNALPVLMVIADDHDFYYQEYGDTRASLEAAGVEVDVAATTLSPSTPHANSGQGTAPGIVVPDLTLAEANADDYSAILFVGGWGSSMYQYDFPGDYDNNHYDGDLVTKEIVNDLIGDFAEQDKYVTAICHGVTVLAWARVDGESPLNGKQTTAHYIGSPAVFYNGQHYGYYQLSAYEQIVENGGLANTVSGQYGDPNTVADDVIVDGRIITAENYDAAALFGQIVAEEVLAADEPDNQAPDVSDVSWQLDENSDVGTVLGTVAATDADAGQTLTWSIIAGNVNNAFAVDAASGQITVSNAVAIDFETTPVFQLTVQVADNGTPMLTDSAIVTINLHDVSEHPPASVLVHGTHLVIQGSSDADRIVIRSAANASRIFVRMNGVNYGSYLLPAGGRTIVHGGDGNDRVFAGRVNIPVSIFGENGHDQLRGGSAADLMDGGSGHDWIWGNEGNNSLRGGPGRDHLFGMSGNDIIVGGPGNDDMQGGPGNDLLIGGMGRDNVNGESGDDLLVSDRTRYDNNSTALRKIRADWNAGGTLAERRDRMMSGNGIRLVPGTTILHDKAVDTMYGGADLDLFFAGVGDTANGDDDDWFEMA